MKTRGAVGMDVRLIMKTRSVVGMDVRLVVKTQGFVGLEMRLIVKTQSFRLAQTLDERRSHNTVMPATPLSNRMLICGKNERRSRAQR